MYDEIRQNGADLLSVAVDLQGPDKPRPYHESAGAQFTTVVDADNNLGPVFGYKDIPNGVLIDEHGVLQYTRFGGFDIRKPEYAAIVREFLQTGTVQEDGGRATTGATPETMSYFERGLQRYRAGDLEGAARVWREGIQAEPDHWNMRKQLWALEHPEKFYQGDVDYGWQKEQIEKGQ